MTDQSLVPSSLRRRPASLPSRVTRHLGPRLVLATGCLLGLATFGIGAVVSSMLVAVVAAVGVGARLVPAGSRLYGTLVVLLAVVVAGTAVPSVLFEQEAVDLGTGVVPLAVAGSLVVLAGFVGGTRRTELFAAPGE